MRFRNRARHEATTGRIRILGVPVLSVLMVAVFGAAVWASSNGDVIHGCYHSVTGNLRVVDATTDCREPEIGIFWNVEGPQGPPGPQGPEGPPGPEGPEGPPGVLGFYTVNTSKFLPSQTLTGVAIICDSDDVAISGGWNTITVQVPEGLRVAASRQTFPDTWRLDIYNDSDTAFAVKAFAVCADLTP